MADVVINTADKTPVELLGQGIKSYDAKDFQAAVAYLSKAAEVAVAQGGDEHESLGDIYLHYGKALLEVSRLEGDPLGDAVPRVEEAEDDDDEEADEANEAEADTPETSKEQDKPEDAKVNNGTAEEKKDGEVKVNGNEEKTDEKTETDVQNGDADKAGPSGESSNDDKAEETDKPDENVEESDLQLAWEVLELARIFFEKGGDKYLTDLAECYITLGEVSLESESFDLAIRDINNGLEIQQGKLGDDSRTLAETHYKLGMAYGMDSKHDDAVKCYAKAMEILKNRMAKTTNEKEKKELEELIPEIDEKISDMKNLKDELAKKICETAAAQFQSSPEKKASDISHLVKRKRKLEDGEETESPAKKSA